MAKMFSSWIAAHGVSVEHSPDRFDRKGNGVTSSVAGAGTGSGPFNNYFHIAIPTPVIVEDRRATLHAVHYLFNVRGDAWLSEVHVFDGPSEIIPAHMNLHVQGNHSGGLDADNGVEVNRDGIAWGIGLTLKFVANNRNADVFFTGFGADFYHDI